MVAFSKVAAVIALAGSASAHAIFQQLWVNGVAAGQNKGIRVPTYNGPITDVLTPAIACNGAPNSMAPFPSDIINVPSGAKLTMEWHHGGNGPDPNDASDPIDPSHKGPIMVYLAKVDSALTTAVNSANWFKIYEDGLNTATNVWAVDKMYAAKGFVDFTLPSCIPPGQYLLRGELIALHGAGTYPGAQFYMSCAQINIVGGGSASPPTVKFPGAYAGSDPGISVNIYYPPLSTYTIPGPRPYTCGGSNPTAATTTTSRAPTTSPRPVDTTTSTTTRTTTTSSRTTTTTSRTTTTGGSSGTGSPLYGQCGGIGWTGPTTCASGRCVANGAYYSQCVP